MPNIAMVTLVIFCYQMVIKFMARQQCLSNLLSVICGACLLAFDIKLETLSIG